MLLSALAAVISLVDGICFNAVTDSVPRTVIERLPAITNASCQFECMKNANCESIYYSGVTPQKCYILGQPSGATCGTPYTRQVKTNVNCPPSNYTANYEPFDPCLKSAVLSPEYTKHGRMPVCPDTPVDGEASARVYVVSIIFPDGKTAIFDNHAQSGIFWNSATKTYDYTSQFTGSTPISQPIYAAMCAYYPAGVINDCVCNPLPFETSTGGIPKAYVPRNNPTGACATGYAGRSIQARSGLVDNCNPCSAYTISCIYQMWIIAMMDGTKTSTFAISNGTCYPFP